LVNSLSGGRGGGGSGKKNGLRLFCREGRVSLAMNQEKERGAMRVGEERVKVSRGFIKKTAL